MTYEVHRLPQLWTMVETDDGSAAAYHLNTWERQITLLSEQSKRLKDLRADLVARWPPEQSDASFAFVSRITEMINAMDQTVDDSVRVRTGLKQVADALEGARKQLAPLLAEYHDKGAAWRSATHGVFPSLPVGLVSGAGVVPGADEFVLHAHQKKLDEQARQIMRKADQIVTEAQTPLATRFPDYERIEPGRTLIGPGQSGDNGRPLSGPSLDNASRRFVPLPRFDPPPPASVDPGPVLAGTDPVINPGPLGPGRDVLGTPGLGGVGRTLPGIIGGVSPVANASEQAFRRLPPDQAVLRPGRVIDGRSPSLEPQQTNRSTTPGFLGGMPIGRAQADVQPSDRGRRYTVPGRVIEGGGIPVANSINGGWRDRQYEEYVKQRQEPITADPDNPWTVAEGIAPVIEPPRERRHDVGPGVIGIDR